MLLKKTKISKSVQITFLVLLLVLAGCEEKAAKAPVSSDDPMVPVVEANVWIDKPLDGTTLTTYIPTEIIMHGYVKTGVHGFSVQIGDDPAYTIPWTIHNTTYHGIRDHGLHPIRLRQRHPLDRRQPTHPLSS